MNTEVPGKTNVTLLWHLTELAYASAFFYDLRESGELEHIGFTQRTPWGVMGAVGHSRVAAKVLPALWVQSSSVCVAGEDTDHYPPK